MYRYGRQISNSCAASDYLMFLILYSVADLPMYDASKSQTVKDLPPTGKYSRLLSLG